MSEGKLPNEDRSGAMKAPCDCHGHPIYKHSPACNSLRPYKEVWQEAITGVKAGDCHGYGQRLVGSVFDQLVEALRSGSAWHYCNQCAILVGEDEYQTHEDHTCTNCGESVFEPIYMVPDAIRKDALKAAGEEADHE